MGELETGFYTKPAWQAVGTDVQEVETAEEAIVKSGLDWEVEKANLYHDVNGVLVPIDGKYALRRKTDNRILGYAGEEYVPIQNKQAFQFFDGVVAQKQGAYQSAGSLRGGKFIWIAAKVDATVSIKGDEVEKFLVLMNAHDFSSALKIFFTPTRVQCYNVLKAIASKAHDETFYTRHYGTVQAKLETVKDIITATSKYYEHFGTQALALAEKKITAKVFEKMLVYAFKIEDDIENIKVNFDDYSTRRKAQFALITEIFDGKGKGLADVNIKHTRWAAFNAVVEYIDYYRITNEKNSADNRLENVWGRGGMQAKNRAWEYLLRA